MTNDDHYMELCTSYRAIDDFRQKLLSFLPLASGGIFAFLVDPKFLGACAASIDNPLLPAVGLLGFMVTLGLFCFEIYGIRRCTYLILVGAYLECHAGLAHGQFRDRPPPVLGFIAEPMAAGIIYPAVMAAWAYLAAYFQENCDKSAAAQVAAGVFLVFAGFLIWFQMRLKKEQACWQKKAGLTALSLPVAPMPPLV